MKYCSVKSEHCWLKNPCFCQWVTLALGAPEKPELPNAVITARIRNLLLT